MSSYTIYNASAGSGKTYGLVKAFLKIILEEKTSSIFKNMLAITFTNKAVNEMKLRIVQTLSKFYNEGENNDMFIQLKNELNLNTTELKFRAEQALKHILFNYSALSISTIDSFNHKIVRNFAFDLKINPNFEISTDSQTLILRAIDKLQQKIQPNNDLTQWLVSFSKEKINADKNWNLDDDLLRVGTMIEQENHYPYLQEIQNKKLSDFKQLKTQLENQKTQNFNHIKKCAEQFAQLCEKENLNEKDFNRGYVYKFFFKIHQYPEKILKEKINWNSQWINALINKENLYAKSYKGDKKDVLDLHLSNISKWFCEIKKNYVALSLYNEIIRNLTPLALINQIQQEIKHLKQEENIIPLYEINKLIFNEIINQPAPFIYERIGERFHHFFVDEFQDTSFMQWKNLIPLIGNALQSENSSQNTGSLLVVGDAKQSIYRWRGGRSEQLMNLSNNNPFFVSPKVENLSENYRSLPEIVSFNNHFYEYISQKIFNNDAQYKELYGLNAKQKIPNSTLKKGYSGYVSISFLEKTLSDQKNELHCQKVIECIEKSIKAGASYSDICILVRQKNHGNIIADYLTKQGVQVISSNSLLIKNAPHIKLLILILKLITNLENQTILFETLIQYAQIKNKNEAEIHSFIMEYLQEGGSLRFFENQNFSLKKFHATSLLEGILYIIKTFEIHQKSDAYISRFIDLVIEFKSRQTKGLSDFLLYWEKNENEISLDTPEGVDAVSIMTIHRSKGLSAPVIIFAFACSDWNSYNKDETHWIEVEPEKFNGFSHLLVSPKPLFSEFSPYIEEEFSKLQKQKCIDNINVLYVATTRPESMLFIITEEPNEKETLYSYEHLFKMFITSQSNLWKENQNTFEKGVLQFEKNQKNQPKQTPLPFTIRKNSPMYNIVTPSEKLWNTSLEKSRKKGLLIHEILQHITYKEDIETILKDYILQGTICEKQAHSLNEEIRKIVYHKQLSAYFEKPYQIDNEREFISSKGEYFRPDRIAYNPTEKSAVIIDYKTGKQENKHTDQILNYAKILKELGWNVKETLLVYISKDIQIKRC